MSDTVEEPKVESPVDDAEEKPKRQNNKQELPENYMTLDCEAEIKKLVKVAKPDRNKQAEESKSMQMRMDNLKKEIANIDKEIKELFEGNKGSENDPKYKAINKMKELQKEIGEILETRNHLYEQKDKMEERRDAEHDAARKQKSSSKYSTIEQIDERIAEIEYIQNSSELSKLQEKSLINELKNLNQSKRELELTKPKVETPAVTGSNDKEIFKQLREQIKECNTKLSELHSQQDEQRKILDSIQEKKQQSKIPQLKELKKEKKQQMSDLYQEMQDKRKQQKVLADEYYKYSRQLKYWQHIQYEQKKEIDRKKKEEEERIRKEIESKLKPWTKEIQQCDLLIKYLNSYKQNENSEADEEKPTEVKKEITLPNGQVVHLLEKKETDFVKAAPKKKRNQKKTSQPKKLNFDLEMISIFDSFHIPLPKTFDVIDETIAKLEETKKYFDTLPREATPFAK